MTQPQVSAAKVTNNKFFFFKKYSSNNRFPACFPSTEEFHEPGYPIYKSELSETTTMLFLKFGDRI